MRFITFLFLLCLSFSGYAQEGTLIVLNKSDDTADLIDLRSGKSVATIPTGNGPHEVAVSPDGSKAIITNYGRGDQWPGNSLTVLDIKSMRVEKTIILDYRAPHGIEFISENQVLVTCEADKNLLLVNIDSGNIEKALDTEQEVSHMVCYSPLSQKAFVTNIRSGSVSVMDLKANRLEKIIKTGDGAEGVALSADGKTIWVTNRGEDTVSLVDYQSLEIKKSFRSEKFPIRVKTTSDGKYGLISNAKSGDVRIYDGATHDLVKIIPMEVSAVEKEASRLFQDFDDSPVPVGILVHPNNKLAFVANTNADLITVIDLVKLEIKGRLTAGKEPDGLGFSPIQLN